MLHSRLTLILPLLMLLAACGSESTAPGTPDGDTGAPALRYQFDVGKQLRYRTTMDMQSTGGMFEMKQNQEQMMLWEVKAIDDAGTASIEVTTESMKMRMDSPGGVMAFDSTDADAAEADGNPLAASLGAFVGSKMTTRMTPLGRIESIDGLDEIMEKAMAGNPMGASMASAFSDEKLTQSMQGIAYFPETTPKVGETWNQTFENPAGMGTMVIELTNTFVGTEVKDGNTIATIEATGTFDKTALQEGEEANPMAEVMASMNISDGKMRGQLLFDMTSGHMVMQTFTISMKVEAMGQAMEMTSTMRAQLE